jgi:hypothetical protein
MEYQRLDKEDSLVPHDLHLHHIDHNHQQFVLE